MKQVIQNIKDGTTDTIEIPYPSISKNHVIIKSKMSLISAGTEKMLVEFGKSSYLGKAKQQPEKVKMVLDKIKTDGLGSTIEAVQSKLNQPIPLGYSNVGEIIEIGENVNDFSIGDIVVSNGPHAEIFKVSKNLCAKVPDGVDLSSAAFVVIGSIALQGIRLAKPTIGESFVVIGAGLIGLLTTQILIANGCKVLAMDYDNSKLEIAKKYGAQTLLISKDSNPVSEGIAFSNGNGVDGVIITTTTQSNDPVKNAAQMSRQRGRVILVGVAGLNIDRSDFYEKELTFQVSCSYGPGRYDSSYENKGNDYPFGFVRWTEQRNFIAILDLMKNHKLDVSDLITKIVEFKDVKEAYKDLIENKDTLGLLLEYSSSPIKKNTTINFKDSSNKDGVEPCIAFIGAGNYASRVLIPNLKKTGAFLDTLVTQGSIDGTIQAKKHGFCNTETKIENILENKEINTVVIASRHDSHSELVTKSILANKNVFVEKPLSINKKGLDNIKDAIKKMNKEGKNPILMVGYNRRYSKFIKKINSLVNPNLNPVSFIMTMNAGFIDPEHWTQDPLIGGGRILGEACHYIDLMRFMAKSPISKITSNYMENDNNKSYKKDTAIINVSFKNGSIGCINYFSNGSSKSIKENIKVYSDGKILDLQNFKYLKGYGFNDFKKMSTFFQDKGQANCINEFVTSIKAGKNPIPIDEIFEIAEKTLDIVSE